MTGTFDDWWSRPPLTPALRSERVGDIEMARPNPDCTHALRSYSNWCREVRNELKFTSHDNRCFGDHFNLSKPTPAMTVRGQNAGSPQFPQPFFCGYSCFHINNALRVLSRESEEGFRLRQVSTKRLQ
jgi:hypothetical protein